MARIHDRPQFLREGRFNVLLEESIVERRSVFEIFEKARSNKLSAVRTIREIRNIVSHMKGSAELSEQAFKVLKDVTCEAFGTREIAGDQRSEGHRHRIESHYY
jgi:hypothetical protein